MLMLSIACMLASQAWCQGNDDADLKIQGEYTAPGVGLQVIALGDGDFEFAIYPGGLPGAGWDKSPPQRADGDADAVQALVNGRKFSRVERSSPTLGQRPPAEAIVLFDGTEQSMRKWKEGAKRTNDGLLAGGATTVDTFRDYTLHAEFRTPFQPKEKGQRRGNSGIYHQGRYETQILDSFGLIGKNNEAGGIYEVRDPDLNMCYPPLQWQTYDIDFTSARFDAAGKKTRDAMLTVRLNGIVVHRDVAVPSPTRAAPFKETPEPGPIHLQDHGNPVTFRNIWIVPRDADRESLRPRVPGFERFFAQNDGDSSGKVDRLGGRLLIAQLGCVACHKSGDPHLQPKSAPNLSHVGGRIRLDHLVSFIGQPRGVKSGTTMPDMLHGLSAEDRAARVAEIVSWLATTGKLMDRPADTAAIGRGKELYHSLGCAACHATRSGPTVPDATSIPLGDLTAKYTLDGLVGFLINPHAIRASGSMPKVVNGITEARDIACYLLGDAIVAPGSQQFTATVYHGTWDSLPDFDTLKAERTETVSDLNLKFVGRRDNFAVRFDAYLPIQTPGQYTFYLGSDDGSRLLIDDKEVIKHDGIHPFGMKEGKRKLDAGLHRLRIEYFEKNGQEELRLEIEGADFGRVPAALVVTNSQEVVARPIIADKFEPVQTLVKSGSESFQKLGCANCHAVEQADGPRIQATVSAPNLDSLKIERGGCLAIEVKSGLPDYSLSPSQRRAITAALKSLTETLSSEDVVHVEMARQNCYACHSRQSIGGPEATRDPLFLTRMQEMGNEARIPPPLTGVGDKLKPEVLKSIIKNGAKDRPYMVTRMPAFGGDTANAISDRLVELDLQSAKTDTAKAESAKADTAKAHMAANPKWIAQGRKLVGSGGLACIKCHTFGNKGTPGIQAINMQTMTERLREDWFQRYMLAPADYRPGTRMPLSFPDGKSVLTSVLDGDAKSQIRAMWMYLEQGKNAKPPAGLDAQAIVLVPDKRPILYRNFIQGLSPRGIAVGYPEKVNLAWDANTLALALVWKNDFIDAGKHWVGRGPGNQAPLGDLVLNVESRTPVATLESATAPWPDKTARELGHQFLGYVLNSAGQPTFRYRVNNIEVEDALKPLLVDGAAAAAGFERTITVRNHNAKNVFIRLARGKVENKRAGVFVVDGQLELDCGNAPVQIVRVGQADELRMALQDPEQNVLSVKMTW